ncbi:hypothetical protein C8R43DRAFT_1132412 [Mycena crocata]|nr:hypothetical protein C8R43DRAFT_1132412 [Mycena crocata]
MIPFSSTVCVMAACETIHILALEPLLMLVSSTRIHVKNGKSVIPSQRLSGAIGFVSFSQDARLKAVHNLSSDRYDLYDPAESLIPLLSVSPTGKTNKIKASSFAENGRTLVCGGDEGHIYAYDLGGPNIEMQAFDQPDLSTICALTTCTTKYYHLIVSGESDSAARIFLWGKPTEQKLADEEELAQEQRRMDAQAVNEVREKARLDEEVADTEKTRKEEEEKINDLNAHMEEYRTQAFGALLVSLAFAALIMFRRIWLEKLRMYVGMPVEDVANTAHLDELFGS